MQTHETLKTLNGIPQIPAPEEVHTRIGWYHLIHKGPVPFYDDSDEATRSVFAELAAEA